MCSHTKQTSAVSLQKFHVLLITEITLSYNNSIDSGVLMISFFFLTCNKRKIALLANILDILRCFSFVRTHYTQVSGSKIWQMERSCMCCQESGEREASVALFCPRAKAGETKFRKVKLSATTIIDE